MSDNILRLNENKSEITLSGPLKSVPILEKHLGSFSSNIKPDISSIAKKQFDAFS